MTIYLESNQIPAALRSGYTGKKFAAKVTESVFVPSDAGLWSGGSRDVYSLIELETGARLPFPGQDTSPFNGARQEREIPLKPGCAMVRHTTFQGRDPAFQAFALLCMASCETESDQLLASACGWRTFRAKKAAETRTTTEIGCPAAKENGARTNCAACGLCAGNSSKSPKDIVINLHGFRVGKAA